TYLMILAWKNDFMHTEQPQQIVATSTEVSPENTWENDLPDVTQAPADIDSDIALIEEKNDTSANNNTSTSSIINVKTDIYDLDIDLIGGDITRVALLNYPRSVDTPNE